MSFTDMIAGCSKANFYSYSHAIIGRSLQLLHFYFLFTLRMLHYIYSTLLRLQCWLLTTPNLNLLAINYIAGLHLSLTKCYISLPTHNAPYSGYFIVSNFDNCKLSFTLQDYFRKSASLLQFGDFLDSITNASRLVSWNNSKWW